MNTEERPAYVAGKEPDSPMTPEQQDRIVHDKTNCWFDGKKWIPVENLSKGHLQQAKLFAQRKEEILCRKSWEFGEKVEMLEKEAERRGIVLKDYHSKFRRSEENAKKVNQSL